MRVYRSQVAVFLAFFFSLVLVGLAMLFLKDKQSFNRQAVAYQASSKPSREKVAGIYLFFDHGLYPGGLKASKDNLGIITGSHNMFAWKGLEPSPGKYDFSDIDTWLKKLDRLGKKGMFGIMLRCEGYGKLSEDGCTPEWALAPAYDPVVVPNPGGDCNIGEKKRLNYLNPQVQSRVQAMVKALADHYGNDPRIGVIMIAPGFNGEPKPQPSSDVYCFKKAEKAAYSHKGYTSNNWSEFNQKLIRFYSQAFDQKQNLVVITTGTWLSHNENIVRVQAALKDGVGFHNSGLSADFPSGSSIGGQCADKFDNELAYRSHWMASRLHGEEVISSFEPHLGSDRRGLLGDHQNLDQRSYTWWSVLNALSKKASIITPYSESINLKWQTWGTGQTNPQWQWRDLDAWQFAAKYLGKTPQTTPDAWVAFRTSLNRYCGDNFDFDFYLTPIDRFDYPVKGHKDDNGHYGAELSGEAKRLGDDRPNKVGWVGPRNDWRGAYTREISERYKEITLDLDDRLSSRLPSEPKLKVVFYDGKAPDQGKKWALKYLTDSGVKTKEFQLNGSDRWREETVKLVGFKAQNSLGGGDISLIKTGSKPGPVYFHFVSFELKPTQNQEEPRCVNQPDLTRDGRVDLWDYIKLARLISQTDEQADLNCDGKLDLSDRQQLISKFSLF